MPETRDYTKIELFDLYSYHLPVKAAQLNLMLWFFFHIFHTVATKSASTVALL